MEHCGIDLHQAYSEICIIDDEGEVVERSRVRTSKAALTRVFGRRQCMRIALEAGGSSPWVSRLLEGLGHEVMVCSPRRVRLIAESTLKDDAIDAEVLARLVRMDPGFLKPIRHRSERAQLVRSKLLVRRSLVAARTGWINTVRGLLRSFGYRVPGKGPATFVARAHRVQLPVELAQVIEPLLSQLEAVSTEIGRCDAELAELAGGLPEAERLRQVPGVGPITALYFVLTIDDPHRFRRSRDVAAYFGLRPSMRSSGGTSHYGRITKEGDHEMRRLLVQAAHAMMLTRADCSLKRWAEGLKQRRGAGKATVALARKLAVLLHHLWVTGEDFEAFPKPLAA